MRQLRPTLFSDTKTVRKAHFSRPEFEYHLDTLTNRKQEYEFENFCRRLVEQRICPNLRPQTGPTGGGDSKVDSETIPVADEVSIRWWIGSPSAGRERWAFAFSAKEDWRAKVKADVSAIHSTRRAYNRIYFLTNQFAQDRKRAELEDRLSASSGRAVHILDRSWIVDRVYESDRGNFRHFLAALGVTAADIRAETKPGPRDTSRAAELSDLDRRLADPSEYNGTPYQLTEDCLESALLARGLERPRHEVEGRFERAQRLAREFAYGQQILRVSYHRAWTAFWWYEDYVEFIRHYAIVEGHASLSSEYTDLDLLLNLWTLLKTSVHLGRIPSETGNLDSRSRTLTDALNKLAADSVRPNNALCARTGMARIQLLSAYHGGEANVLEAGFVELGKIVDEGSKLGEYPLETLFEWVTVLGESVSTSAYNSLYEKLADLLGKRRGEGEKGIAYAERGRQLLMLKKASPALIWLGRAEEYLRHEEYREQLVIALKLSSAAYQSAGLLWAARNRAVVAAERETVRFAKEGGMNPTAVSSLQLLVGLELQIGRIPHVLGAMRVADFFAHQLNLTDADLKRFAEIREMQTRVLSLHFLNLPFSALQHVSRLPDLLKRVGLDQACLSLLFVLGQEPALREGGFLTEEEELDSVQHLFEELHDDPVSQEVAGEPTLVQGETCTLRSIVFGVEILLDASNNWTSLGIAEMLLGGLEAFLATTNDTDVFPTREGVRITVRQVDQSDVIRTSYLDEPSSEIAIRHRKRLDIHDGKVSDRLTDWLQECIVQVAFRMISVRDPDAWMRRTIKEERAMARVAVLGGLMTHSSNLLGQSGARLDDWIHKEDRDYGVLRSAEWRSHEVRPAKPEPLLPSGEASSGTRLAETSVIKHSERRVRTPIDVPLWDRAQWRATVFLTRRGEVPVLGLGFLNQAAAEQIFRKWKTRWGAAGPDSAIRVAIVTGVSGRCPAEYAVSVGPRTMTAQSRQPRLTLEISRINRMAAVSSQNLDRFLKEYSRVGRFLLAPVVVSADPVEIQKLGVALGFEMKDLAVRQAWEIGPNDVDQAVLHIDQDPHIPDGIDDPPVLQTLKKLRKRK